MNYTYTLSLYLHLSQSGAGISLDSGIINRGPRNTEQTDDIARGVLGPILGGAVPPQLEILTLTMEAIIGENIPFLWMFFQNVSSKMFKPEYRFVRVVMR